MITKGRVEESESSQYFCNRVGEVLTDMNTSLHKRLEKDEDRFRVYIARKRNKLKFNAVSGIWYKSTTIARPYCDSVDKHNGVKTEE